MKTSRTSLQPSETSGTESPQSVASFAFMNSRSSLVKPFDIFREARGDEEPEKRNDAGESAFKDEDPSLTAVVIHPIHFPGATGDQASEGTD